MSDRFFLGEKSTSLVVKQIGDKTTTLDGLELPTALLPKAITEGQSVRVTITIESPHTRNEWSHAYAKQGASDLKVYRLLATSGAGISECHRLHYLQMAGEKIGKAYQFRHTSKSIEALSSKHVALADFIKLYCLSGAMKKRYAGRDAQLASIRQELNGLATEIEKLAPAVDRQQSPTNVEYPWTNGVALTIPCDHEFPLMQSHGRDIWTLFAKTLDDAATDLLR